MFEQHIRNDSPGHRSSLSLRESSGWSLIEMMTVLAITLTLASITTVVSLQPVLKQQRINTSYNDILTTLRHVHDQAAADMRVYVVSFATPGTVTVTQNTLAGPLLLTTTLPADVTFHLEAGLPNSPTVAPTTPDGFGSAGFAMDFNQGIGAGGGTTIYFQPDGTATDINGNLNNGVVYFGRPGDLYSSRAITLWGTTGRLRGWRLYPNGAQNVWRQQ